MNDPAQPFTLNYFQEGWVRTDHPDGRICFRPTDGAVSRTNPEVTFWPDGRVTEAWT